MKECKLGDAVLYTGDCVDILREIPSDSIDIAYVDPPFCTQKMHILGTRSRDREFRFSDVWDSHEEYARFIVVRLQECHRVLAQTGSLFFHCDHNAAHVIRLLLDKVFGDTMFLSEIIWHYRRWSNSRRGLLPAHQTIFWYSKTKDYKYHQLFTGYSSTTNIDQILQKRRRDNVGRVVYDTDTSGNTLFTPQKNGVPLSDVWDIPFLNPKAQERVGYPTQKPVLLIDRMIEIATDPGDTVLDPFCGSGTALVSASLNGRRSIGIDVSEDAISIATDRLRAPFRTDSLLLDKGRDAYNVVNQEALAVLTGLDVVPVQRNRGIDGFINNLHVGTPVPIRVQKEGESLYKAGMALYEAARDKGARVMVLIATHNLPDNTTDLLLPESIIVLISTACAVKSAISRLRISEEPTPSPKIQAVLPLI